jgi:hypothetical protein
LDFQFQRKEVDQLEAQAVLVLAEAETLEGIMEAITLEHLELVV